jgi:hypothetical protein
MVCIQGVNGKCACDVGYVTSKIDSSCQVLCLNSTSSLSNGIVGAYHFENSLLNTITTGSPYGSAVVSGGGSISYSGGAITGTGIILSGGAYLTVNTITTLTDFTYAL